MHCCRMRCDPCSTAPAQLIAPELRVEPHLIELLNCAVERGVPVLLVHVVVACPRLVPHPDAKIFDGGRPLLEDLDNSQAQLKPDIAQVDFEQDSDNCAVHVIIAPSAVHPEIQQDRECRKETSRPGSWLARQLL